MFGSDAVFWNTSKDIFGATTKISGTKLVYWKEHDTVTVSYNAITSDQAALASARSRYVKKSRLPPFPVGQTCSIELLGYVRMGRNAPFRLLIDRFNRPPTGTATLQMQINGKDEPPSDPWQCYYRAVYSNRRVSEDTDSFWPVLIYCPASIISQKCKSFEQQYIDNRYVSYQLLMKLRRGVQWRAAFDTYRPLIPFKASESIAVCTAWPYTTYHVDKVKQSKYHTDNRKAYLLYAFNLPPMPAGCFCRSTSNLTIIAAATLEYALTAM